MKNILKNVELGSSTGSTVTKRQSPAVHSRIHQNLEILTPAQSSPNQKVLSSISSASGKPGNPKSWIYVARILLVLLLVLNVILDGGLIHDHYQNPIQVYRRVWFVLAFDYLIGCTSTYLLVWRTCMLVADYRKSKRGGRHPLGVNHTAPIIKPNQAIRWLGFLLMTLGGTILNRTIMVHLNPLGTSFKDPDSMTDHPNDSEAQIILHAFYHREPIFYLSLLGCTGNVALWAVKLSTNYRVMSWKVILIETGSMLASAAFAIASAASIRMPHLAGALKPKASFWFGLFCLGFGFYRVSSA